MKLVSSSGDVGSAQGSAFLRPSLSQGQTSNCLPQPVFIYYFNSYCSQFLFFSQTLTHELALNNALLSLALPAAPADAESASSTTEPSLAASNKNTSQVQEQQADELQFKDKIGKSRGRSSNSQDQDSYVPEEEPSRVGSACIPSESKNIPKNYGKAILIFIHRHEAYAKRVLTFLNQDWREFMRSVKKLKGKVRSIRQLKALWVEEENSFAKAYRIISLEYLRRHSLPYIFNSRVENFGNHIKYRYRIAESVADPHNFTVIKQF